MSTLKLQDVIGDVCVSVKDADQVYEKLLESVQEHNEVALSFEGIKVVTTTFLSNSIGKLYETQTPEDISSYIEFTETDDLLDQRISRIQDKAIELYAS